VASGLEPLPAGDPFGDVLNGIQKYVVSTTLPDTSLWCNSTIIRSNVVEAVRNLKAQPGKHILLDGSSGLAHTLIALRIGVGSAPRWHAPEQSGMMVTPHQHVCRTASRAPSVNRRCPQR
jgi:hypothetical protein